MVPLEKQCVHTRVVPKIGEGGIPVQHVVVGATADVRVGSRAIENEAPE